MAIARFLHQIALHDKVRFKEERLEVLSPPDRKRLEGRVGVVQGHWNYSRKLTVHFPQDGMREELRILSVDPRHIELADIGPVETDLEPKLPPEAGGDGKLSQSEMDNLFG